MNWRLLAGRLRDAWQAYPEARRRYAAIPPGPNIFLTGTHRSGTTWLAKMLAASGIWYVHEPYAPKKGRWPRSFEFRESGRADPAADKIAFDVLRGDFRAALNLPNADHPMMPLRLFRPRMNRMLIKDPLACLMTEYLTSRHGFQTLILFRHPAGFASSLQRLGWPRAAFLRQFLADESLMAVHLEPYRTLIERHSKEDGIAAAAVLHGALNTVLWHFAEAGVGTPVQFENLCRDPLEQLRDLFGQLKLPYDDTVREAHRQACFGHSRSVDSYHPHAVARNSLAMADSWKLQLPADDVRSVREIWERFDLPLYRSDEDWRSGSATQGQVA